MATYKNIFTEKNLSRLMRPHDSRRYGKNIKRDRDLILNSALSTALSTSTDFSSGVFSSKIKGKACSSIKDYSKVLITRAITEHIQHIYKIKTPNRDKIVLGVIETLCDSTPMYIFKKDIKSFYESIETAQLNDLFFKRKLLPFYTRILLRKFFDRFCSTPKGIPRGLGLSSALSEIFLLDFDEKVRNINGVYRYFRYVDDIIIFCTSRSALEKIDLDLNKCLPLGLEFNKEKSTPPIYVDCSINQNKKAKSFDYLGYEFSFTDIIDQKRPRTVDVSIASKKIKKIKTKIVLSLKSFAKNHDAQLLLDRIKFISSNYLVKRRGNEKIQRSKFVKSGIFYNYSLCGSYKGKDHAPPQWSSPSLGELCNLDMFYQTIIGRNSKFKSVVTRIPLLIQQEIRKISFKKGYEHRMIVKFKESRVKEIKKVWINHAF